MRVNYLIAACSYRVGKVSGGIEGKDVLKLHFEQLAKTDTSKLAQVTVLRALPLVRNGNYPQETEYYWDVDKLTPRLRCPTVTLDIPNRYFSYSSWIQAVQRYREEFDYYILIEDDYYPALNNFVDELIRLHRKKLPAGGYLCSFAYKGFAAVCNGIVDAPTFCHAIDKYPDPIEAISSEAQRRFLAPHVFDNQIADYTDEYRTLFGACTRMIHQAPIIGVDDDIFRPVEYLAPGVGIV